MILSLSLPAIIKKLSAPLDPIPVDKDTLNSISINNGKKQTKSKFKALLFDLYGTLFISEGADKLPGEKDFPPIFFTKAFKICGMEELTQNILPEDFANYFKELIKKAHNNEIEKDNPAPEVEIREIWHQTICHFDIATGMGQEEIEKLAVVYENLTNKTWLMPNLVQTLHFATSKSVQLGIISNAQFYSPLIFEAHLGALPEELGFNKKLCYYSYEDRIAKPGIAMFEKAAAYLKKEKGIVTEETLFIGNDMLNDIEAAAKVGIQTCLFAGDKRSLRLRDENIDTMPDYMITKLDALQKIIEGDYL